jgi:hypothetical protein
MRIDAPSFLTLARKPDLDQEMAFTICRMISSVGWDFVEDWDWNWLEKANGDYRALINHRWLDGAWERLAEKDWYSEQTTNDVDKKISTIVPLRDMAKLRTLVLQNNRIIDLQPISGMMELRDLNIYSNHVRDISVLGALPTLEKLSLANNPIESLRVIEELPRLQKLTISPDQVAAFNDCRRLSRVYNLHIGIDGEVEDFTHFPDLPSLKVLHVWHPKSLNGIERFTSLETLHLTAGKFSSLEPLQDLKSLTHLSLSTSQALDMETLKGLYALRKLVVIGQTVRGLRALVRLPALHEVGMDDESTCDASDLQALRDGLSSWDSEFKTDAKEVKPSLDLQVVDQATFDYYDSKAPFGILPGECNEEMLDDSERNWLLARIGDALSVKFEDEKDFHLPYTSGFQRTERVIIYGIRAYESFREVALAVQEILCSTRNDWIIWCQSLLWESPEEQEIPDGAEDFIVWIYPDKIMVAEEHAEIVRKLIEWRN